MRKYYEVWLYDNVKDIEEGNYDVFGQFENLDIAEWFFNNYDFANFFAKEVHCVVAVAELESERGYIVFRDIVFQKRI